MKRQTLKAALIFGIMLSIAPYLIAYENYESRNSNPQLSNLKEGRVKILAIALYPAHYDSIELADRLESEIIAVRTGAPYYPNEFQRKVTYYDSLRVTEEEMEQDALAALASDYDIIIIGANPPWSAYPKAVRNGIIDKVENGAPLIIFGSAKEVFNELKETGNVL